MQIWDTAGQEKFDSITLNYFKNADVAIFVYAINDKNSFNKIEQWDNQLNDKINIIDNDRNNTLNDEQDIEDKKDIDDKKDKDDKKDTDKDKNENINVKQEEINKNLIKVLLGNKKDLENERQVTYEEGEQLSKSKNFDLFKEISSSLEIGENGECYVDDIINLFNIIGKKIYKDFIKKDYGRLNSSSYCYQASSSILKGNKYEKNKKKDKSCCC
jgi:GTPase SAR1 family protein